MSVFVDIDSLVMKVGPAIKLLELPDGTYRNVNQKGDSYLNTYVYRVKDGTLYWGVEHGEPKGEVLFWTKVTNCAAIQWDRIGYFQPFTESITAKWMEVNVCLPFETIVEEQLQEWACCTHVSGIQFSLDPWMGTVSVQVQGFDACQRLRYDLNNSTGLFIPGHNNRSSVWWVSDKMRRKKPEEWAALYGVTEWM